MQFIRRSNGDHVAYAIGSQPEYRLLKQTGSGLRWTAQAAVPNDMGGYSDIGYIGSYATLVEAKRAANYAERLRLGNDPNADRKAYLRAEINEAINHIVADAHALAKAQADMDRDSARLEKLQKELNGIVALEAREENAS